MKYADPVLAYAAAELITGAIILLLVVFAAIRVEDAKRNRLNNWKKNKRDGK
ncbi:MAG: hypothetical protein KGL39_55700 [Patescibacteria group bacterium]|nr:hypothetical protein [Patescibacteria group bacterium]